MIQKLTKSKKSKGILLILAISMSMLVPSLFISNASASEYMTEHAIIEIKMFDNGNQMCTLQFETIALTYNPGSGLWRILDYNSGIRNEFHYQIVVTQWWWIFPIAWDTRYVFEILDIDWYEYSVPHVGIIIAGSTWRFKLYERLSPNKYFIFDLKAYVVAGGGSDVTFTDVSITHISEASNGWTHTVSELYADLNIKAVLELLCGLPYY